jgi:hypothetical protein
MINMNVSFQVPSIYVSHGIDLSLRSSSPQRHKENGELREKAGQTSSPSATSLLGVTRLMLAETFLSNKRIVKALADRLFLQASQTDFGDIV